MSKININNQEIETERQLNDECIFIKYICPGCKVEFKLTTPIDTMINEHNYRKENIEKYNNECVGDDLAIICDDCFKKIMSKLLN